MLYEHMTEWGLAAVRGGGGSEGERKSDGRWSGRERGKERRGKME